MLRRFAFLFLLDDDGAMNLCYGASTYDWVTHFKTKFKNFGCNFNIYDDTTNVLCMKLRFVEALAMTTLLLLLFVSLLPLMIHCFFLRKEVF